MPCFSRPAPLELPACAGGRPDRTDRAALAALAALLLLAAPGCKLDGFIYAPERVDAYVLEPIGDTPGVTVSPDRIEPLRLTVDEKVSLGAVYVKGSQKPPRGYVLFFHGKSSHLDLEFHRIKRFSNYGYDVLAFDYRGFGASTNVTPTEEGLEADGRAAGEYLRGRAGEGARIILWGDSFGTAPASQRAHADNPRGLILEEPFASLQFFAQDSARMDLPGSFVTEAGWNTAARVHDLKSVPKLIVHGTADELIDKRNSEYIYEHAQEPKRLVLLEGGTHGHLHEHEAYRATINDFLDQLVP